MTATKSIGQMIRPPASKRIWLGNRFMIGVGCCRFAITGDVSRSRHSGMTRRLDGVRSRPWLENPTQETYGWFLPSF